MVVAMAVRTVAVVVVVVLPTAVVVVLLSQLLLLLIGCEGRTVLLVVVVLLVADEGRVAEALDLLLRLLLVPDTQLLALLLALLAARFLGSCVLCGS